MIGKIIDWLLEKTKSKKIEEYTYDEAKVPLRTPEGCPRNDKFWYTLAVRYNEDEMQIYYGLPKNVGWKTVESENLKHIIKQQINDQN